MSWAGERSDRRNIEHGGGEEGAPPSDPAIDTSMHGIHAYSVVLSTHLLDQILLTSRLLWMRYTL